MSDGPIDDVSPLQSRFDEALAPKERKKRGRKPGSRNALKLSAKDIRDSVYSLLTLANTVARNVKATAADALADDELSMLVEALTLEVEQNARLQTWLSKVAKVSPHVALAQVAIIIVGRR